MAALIHRLALSAFPSGLIVTVLLVMAGCGGDQSSDGAPEASPAAPLTALAQPDPKAPIDPSTLLAAARSGADFLLQHQGLDGGLAFRLDRSSSAPGGESLRRLDNALLQGGACIALLQVYRQTGVERYLAGAEAGLSLLLEQSRGPRPEDEAAGFLAIVSNDEGSVGASALALLALLDHREATGSRQWEDALDGLARFLSFQQRTDGEILPRYEYGPARGGPFQAPFAASVAAFALLRYARTAPGGALSSWFNSGQRGAGWLMAVRDLGKTYDELAHDPWLLQALDELHEISGGGRTYYLHGRRVAQGILEALEDEGAGCSSQTPRRAQALVSAIRIARRASASTTEYEAALETMLRALLRCPGAVVATAGDDAGGSRSEGSLRSDDVADRVSLFLRAQDLLTLAGPQAPG